MKQRQGHNHTYNTSSEHADADTDQDCICPQRFLVCCVLCASRTCFRDTKRWNLGL